MPGFDKEEECMEYKKTTISGYAASILSVSLIMLKEYNAKSEQYLLKEMAFFIKSCICVGATTAAVLVSTLQSQ